MVSQPRVERLEGDIGITGDTVAFGREDRFCGGRWCDIVVGRRFAVPAVSGHLDLSKQVCLTGNALIIHYA